VCVCVCVVWRAVPVRETHRKLATGFSRIDGRESPSCYWRNWTDSKNWRLLIKTQRARSRGHDLRDCFLPVKRKCR
jgi:hypothetical protein